mmetsp:Transcript_10409/g.35969  ORF Transcript_10409/g.35969 Transcript_10409/m.35969 type:complete len:122 (+) Transcript_10409:123-488(+)
MCPNESSTNTSIQDSSSSNGDDAPVPPSSSANEDEAAAKDAAPAATSVATDRPRRRATPEELIYTQAREPRPSVRPRPAARTRRATGDFRGSSRSADPRGRGASLRVRRDGAPRRREIHHS